ncbi:MAG: porin family protein [Betaproteobacteria bacterium]
MKIKSTLTLAVLLGGLGCMASANAADPVTGFYMGGSLGMASTNVSFNNINSNMTVTDKTDRALSIRTGYRIHTNWAVEGGYADLGTMKYKETGWPDGSMKTSVWHIDAVGIIPLADKIEVFGKVGVAQMNYTFNDGYKDHKTTPHLGLGISYAILPALALRAEYDDYGKAKYSDGSSSVDINSSQFSLGMDYRF